MAIPQVSLRSQEVGTPGGGWTGRSGRPGCGGVGPQGGLPDCGDGVGSARWRAGPALPRRGRPQPAAEHDDHGRACVRDNLIRVFGIRELHPSQASRRGRRAKATRHADTIQVKSVPRPGWNCAPGGAQLVIWPGSMTPTRGYPLPRTEVPPPPRHRGSSRPAEPHSTSTRHPALAGHRDLHLDTAIRLVTRLLRELTRKVP
jgi:hypothetical protein